MGQAAQVERQARIVQARARAQELLAAEQHVREVLEPVEHPAVRRPRVHGADEGCPRGQHAVDGRVPARQHVAQAGVVRPGLGEKSRTAQHHLPARFLKSSPLQ